MNYQLNRDVTVKVQMISPQTVMKRFRSKRPSQHLKNVANCQSEIDNTPILEIGENNEIMKSVRVYWYCSKSFRSFTRTTLCCLSQIDLTRTHSQSYGK